MTVLEVDLARNRISLSMKENPEPAAESAPAPKRTAPNVNFRRPPEKRKPEPFNNPFRKLL